MNGWRRRHRTEKHGTVAACNWILRDGCRHVVVIQSSSGLVEGVEPGEYSTNTGASIVFSLCVLRHT